MLTSTAAPHPTFTAASRVLDQLREELLAERQAGGGWCGELSASALSTATAISALAVLVREGAGQASQLQSLIHRGLAYLDTQQNPDGGYGDTDRSHSNIATSYLVLAARTLAASCLRPAADHASAADDPALAALRAYIDRAGGFEGLRARYGSDKTFVVPIMTNLAIAGLVPWSQVPRLPFEAAVFPGAMYRFLQMPVVSYAIPALVAIGQVHHFLGPRPWWPLHRLRAAAVAPTMRVLQRMQPASGGYLEATPLTAFVLMSLAASGRGDHPVARRGAEFLIASVTEEGSWPIDTNLATWVSSLAIHGLAQDPRDDHRWAEERLIRWHLACQHQQRHPFTGADPGGWGWTDLSGAVPDGDDTPAAILAISRYRRWVAPELRAAADQAAVRGVRWLLDLQNRDGGLPTFCRGWGKLPFDRSSTDLTAHLIRALDAVQQIHEGDGSDRAASAALRQELMRLRPRLTRARQRALTFLRRQQQPDGRWTPLWFGNQDDPQETNPVYGTGRVLLAIAAEPAMREATERAVDFLLSQQNPDGGWGGGPSRSRWLAKHSAAAAGRAAAAAGHAGTLAEQAAAGSPPQVTAAHRSSLEESAVAVEALAAVLRACPGGWQASDAPGAAAFATASRASRCREAIIRGVGFLTSAVDAGEHREPWPIGFYFAKLWYHERLYPLVLTLAALGASLDLFLASSSRELAITTSPRRNS